VQPEFSKREKNPDCSTKEPKTGAPKHHNQNGREVVTSTKALTVDFESPLKAL
jgi:hypothetical protein